MTTLLQLTGGTIIRGGSPILSDLSLSVSSGQTVAVLGPNGVGKTSLAMVLAGRLRLASGKLELFGMPVGSTDIRTLRPRIGYFSDRLVADLDPLMNALDAVALGIHSGLRREWFALTQPQLREADQLLERVGLGWARHRTLSELSSGQRQRVLIARSFMGSPQLMVLDEPTSHLDLLAREETIWALEELLGDLADGRSAVIVSHHLEDLPRNVTHALLIGPKQYLYGEREKILVPELMSKIYGRRIEILDIAGRLFAVAARD